MPVMEAPQAPAIVVVGSREAAHTTPNTTVTVDKEQLRITTNVRNTEDALRYFPSLLVRKRHIGDTQAPLATRTSGVGASARSLVYADGVLLSALIGNNNNFASPRWGMVSPEEIEKIDVLYGPFSAQYPGNAIGAVVNIRTGMPDKLEASATAAGSLQHFHQYATGGDYSASQLAATLGDRMGAFSWFLSANHVDSKSQPLAYVTVASPSSTSTAGTPVTGAFSDLNRTGQPIFVIGAGGIEHQRQNDLKLKLGFDVTPKLHLMWRTGLFLNDTDSNARTYLRNASGVPAYSGTVNIDGRSVTMLEAVQELNRRAGAHGVGRLDMVEDRLVGIKSREVYECPGAIALITAHQELENVTVERDLARFKRSVDQRWAELVYDGLWFSPLKRALDEFVGSASTHVTGDIRMTLHGGRATVTGRRGAASLYEYDLATYDADDTFDQSLAKGFVELWGLPSRIAARRDQKLADGSGA